MEGSDTSLSVHGWADPEEVVALHDPASGLEGVIVIHSTALGPAVGGCRMWHYPTMAETTTDALRLAQGMSYKNALAGLPFGGGKTVLRHPEGAFSRRDLFRALGAALNRLEGRYVTAEDVGTSPADMTHVAEVTGHVGGLDARPDSVGGDPSPWTALGIFKAIEFTCEYRLGKPLCDATIAVQGLGRVGLNLCELLDEVGAQLIASDLCGIASLKAEDCFGAKIVGTDEILSAEADVLAPCALGAILDAQSTGRIKAKIVCGGANNQLAAPEIGTALAARGILYAPDYVVNAGGIIHVAAERLGWSEASVKQRIGDIVPRLKTIFRISETRGIATNYAADDLARAIIGHGDAALA